MKFLDNPEFWRIYWTVFVLLAMVFLVVPDIVAVIRGHKDGVGDSFTLTHWLVKYVGLSIIGAAIGYLTAHFLIVHRNG